MKIPDSAPALLGELIARPSVCRGYEEGRPFVGEAAVGGYVADLLRELGAEVEVAEIQPGRPNVVGRFPAADPAAPVVAFVPHLDTVGIGGMTVPPFAATRHDGRIHGRGACDTKGPLAAALWALAEWRRSPAAARAGVTWVFAATMGEEELSVGANALCRAGFRADFAVVLEPTDLRVVHAEKGVLRVWATAAGRAAHAATPDLGLNAIHPAAAFVGRCAQELVPAFAALTHPLLGAATLNVGVIEGGRALNVVPDRCRVGLDVRTHPGLPNAEALRRIRAVAEGLAIDVACDGPSYALPPTHPWVGALAREARGVTVASWYSDANVFNAHGISAVAFGPGDIAQAHTADEYIVEAELLEGAARLGRFIAETSSCRPR